MNIAVVSDIHGNLPALEAILDDIQQQQPDLMICLGDVATIGPNPREILQILQEQNFICIMGNHDAALLDLTAVKQFQIASPLIPSLQWCRNRLTEGDLDFIKSFRDTLIHSVSDHQKLLCYHGSPNSLTENILAVTPHTNLDQMINSHSSDILVGGHTHLQMMRKFRGKIIINPGSVGCPFLKTPDLEESPHLLPWAEYALITCHNAGLNIQLRRLSFDISRYRQIILESTNPFKSWLLHQYERF